MTDVSVKITSVQSTEESPDEKLCMNVTGKGSLECKKGMIFIRYKEDLSGEGDEVNNIISFSSEDPNTISLVRTGAVSMSCVFAKEKRFACTYDLKFGSMDFTVATTEIQNTVNQNGNGEIHIKYALESRGIVVQNTDYNLFVECR